MNSDVSEALYQQARKVIAGGVNGNIKYRSPHPIFMKSASGAHLLDEDDNVYVDYVMSYGALVLGHGHPVVREAVRHVLDSMGTTTFGAPNETELELSKLIQSLYFPDGEVRLTNSGLEATLLAVRLSIAFTGRKKIAKFDGHYHGANPFLLSNYRPKQAVDSRTHDLVKEPDSAELSGGLLDDMVVLPFNDIQGTKRTLDREKGKIAMLIMEPFEDGYIEADREFMEFLRKYTLDNGIILVFDEVKTGFRIRIGGACEYYGIQPDIVCLGKILGGGLPIGAVCGRSDILNLLDPAHKSEKSVFHSGTFNGNPLSVGTGLATLGELTKNGNFEKLTHISGTLREGIARVLDENGIPHVMYGQGGILNFTLGDKPVRTYRDLLQTNISARRLLDAELLLKGVYTIPASRLSLSLSHTSKDIADTVEKMGEIIEQEKHRFLELSHP